MVSATWSPTPNAGSSEVSGSWKIDRHPVAPDLSSLLGREDRQVPIQQPHLARYPGGAVQEAHDGHGKGGLAASGFTHDTHDLTRIDGQGHVADRRNDLVLDHEPDAQCLDIQDVPGDHGVR